MKNKRKKDIEKKRKNEDVADICAEYKDDIAKTIDTINIITTINTVKDKDKIKIKQI